MEPEKNDIPLSETSAKGAKEMEKDSKQESHDAKQEKESLNSEKSSHMDHSEHDTNKKKSDHHGAKHGSHTHHKRGQPAHKSHKKKGQFDRYATVLIVLLTLVMLFNQTQISAIAAGGSSSSSGSFASGVFNSARLSFSDSGKDLSSVNVNSIKSTAHAVAAVLDVEGIKTDQDAIDAIIPTGTPEYGQELGVTFDDPVSSLNVLARNTYPTMKQDIKQNDPKTWQRYINLASKPVGISCEYCCGVGPIGIKQNGDLNCGCAHAPALHGLTLWLMKNTDYSDAEVLREVMKWKAIFFPRDMVGIGMQVAGGDTSSLKELPGMVGGC